MKRFVKLLILIFIILVGYFAFLLTANFLIMGDLIPAQDQAENFGYTMIQNSLLFWTGCIALGIVSIFIEKKWRYILTLSPLYGPSLFALIYTLTFN